MRKSSFLFTDMKYYKKKRKEKGQDNDILRWKEMQRSIIFQPQKYMSR